ncbi:MAG: serine hydrolase domain-containing protein [Cyclobacteriaceae bacterium]
MSKERSKQLLRIGLAVGTVASLYFVPWPLVWAWILPLPDTVQEQLDEGISHGFDGMIVYIDQAGKPPGLYSAGWHDREKKIPADPEALFKIASIGKLYDAVAITKLVGDGRLSLDKTLAEYFPELAGRIEHAERITLSMMVQHRSGIPNYTDTPGFWTDPPESSEETLALVLDQSADFMPGEDYGYSNTNYLLLSELVEKVTGRSKFEYIQEKVLAPLGLKYTYASMDEVDADKVMSGYYAGIEEDIKMADYGSMVATAEDVAIFLRALNDGSLLSKDEQAIYSSLYEYEHTGLIPGYQSIAKYYPDTDTVIVQFVNSTDFEGYTWSLSEIVYGRIVKIVRREEG